MRNFVLLLGGTCLIFVGITLVEGQQPGGKGKGGGFFGFQQTPVTLIANPQVKEELKLTDEQSEALPAEYLKAIEKVLKPDQFKRFKQIELQVRGNNAFTDKTVQNELKVTADQAKSLNSLVEDFVKERADLQPKFGKGGGGGGDFKGALEKIQNLEKDTREKLLTVLTKDQRKQWREMIGEDFKLQQGFGKKGANKKDAE